MYGVVWLRNKAKDENAYTEKYEKKNTTMNIFAIG